MKRTSVSRLPNAVVGSWVASELNPETTKKYGRAIISFLKNGKYVMKFITPNGSQKVTLNYSIENDIIILGSPALPQTARSQFIVSEDGVLHIMLDRNWHDFVRMSLTSK